jgi:hypothetical protein
MEPMNATPPRAETLSDPDGRPLGRVVAPRPGPVIGRASGTVYLVRQAGRSSGPPAVRAELGYTGRR